MRAARGKTFVAGTVLLMVVAGGRPSASAQAAKEVSLTESGHVMIAGRATPYLIRNLPPNSFPELPAAVAEQLSRRGCLIPQTYEAHGPENVVHGSFERAGSSDWAVLCSAQGTVSLLVFFDEAAHGAAEGQSVTLASARETDRLQAHGPDGVLGFDWAIDTASPQRVHEAQVGMANRPELLDHEAVADSVVEQRTVYHFYAKGAWSLLAMPQ